MVSHADALRPCWINEGRNSLQVNLPAPRTATRRMVSHHHRTILASPGHAPETRERSTSPWLIQPGFPSRSRQLSYILVSAAAVEGTAPATPWPRPSRESQRSGLRSRAGSPSRAGRSHPLQVCPPFSDQNLGSPTP